MKRFIVSAFIAITCLLNAYSQSKDSDLHRMNLKGNVSTVEYFYKHITEEWGEEKTVLSPSRRFYFNPSGNLVYAQILGESEWYDDYTDETAVTKQYLYDSSGKLTTVMYYRAKGELPNSGSIDNLGSREKAEYEYDSSGRLHSITYYWSLAGSEWTINSGYSYYNVRGYERDPQSGYYEGAKEVWNYTADGFTHIICDHNGMTRVKEVATEKGRKVDGRGGISIYDEAGRLVARGGSFVASNGAASYSEYFGYNKQGDLVIESSNADAQKQIEIMPWLKASYNRHGDYFYQYVYDDHGNWIERKKFKTQNGNREPILENTLVRVIGYDSFDFVEKDQQKSNARYVDAKELLNTAIDQFNGYTSEKDPDKGLEAYRSAKKVLEYDIPDLNDTANYIIAVVWPTMNQVGEVRGAGEYLSSLLVGVTYAERAMRKDSEVFEQAKELYNLYVDEINQYDEYKDHLNGISRQSTMFMLDKESDEIGPVDGVWEEIPYGAESLKKK